MPSRALVSLVSCLLLIGIYRLVLTESGDLGHKEYNQSNNEEDDNGDFCLKGKVHSREPSWRLRGDYIEHSFEYGGPVIVHSVERLGGWEPLDACSWWSRREGGLGARILYVLEGGREEGRRGLRLDCADYRRLPVERLKGLSHVSVAVAPGAGVCTEVDPSFRVVVGSYYTLASESDTLRRTVPRWECLHGAGLWHCLGPVPPWVLHSLVRYRHDTAPVKRPALLDAEVDGFDTNSGWLASLPDVTFRALYEFLHDHLETLLSRSRRLDVFFKSFFFGLLVLLYTVCTIKAVRYLMPSMLYFVTIFCLIVASLYKGVGFIMTGYLALDFIISLCKIESHGPNKLVIFVWFAACCAISWFRYKHDVMLILNTCCVGYFWNVQAKT